VRPTEIAISLLIEDHTSEDERNKPLPLVERKEKVAQKPAGIAQG
jgi:hypothetical protein